MASQYMFCPAERGIPNLRRGYRTPDPSPSPSVADVVGQLELRFVGDNIDEDQTEQDMPTPRQHGRQEQRMASRMSVSRTPSPSPVRNFQADASTDKLGYDQEFTMEMCEECPTPRRRFNYPEAAVPNKEALPAATNLVPPQANVMPAQCVFIQPVFVVRGRQPGPCSGCNSSSDEMSPSQSSTSSQSQTATQGAPLASIGSRGHPFTCADACKYVRKNRGCKDGANCDRCHLCVWSGARRQPRRG